MLKKQLTQIEGVGTVEIGGTTEELWEISLKPSICESLNVTPDDISESLKKYFSRIELGFTQLNNIHGGNSILIEASQEPVSPEEWGKIPVKLSGGRVIHLHDVATIAIKEQEPSNLFRVNGQNTVTISLFSERGVNDLKVAGLVKETVSNLRMKLPIGISLSTEYDSTEYISKELNNVLSRLLITILILLGFVLLVSRSFKYLLLIIISMTVNVSICFVLYYITGISIHLYSIAGLTISFGMIVDNTIVMTDHMIHYKKRRIFLALLASTLTTVAALIFIFTLPEKQRITLTDFSLIIIINLAVSLLVALFFIPSLLDYLKIGESPSVNKINRLRHTAKWSAWYTGLLVLLMRNKKKVIILAILGFGLPIFLLPQKVPVQKWYSGLYNSTIGSQWYNEQARPVVNKVLGGSLRLFYYYVYEGSYFSKPERPALHINASMKQGATIKQVDAALRQIENYLLQYNQIEKFITRIYSPQHANITVWFKKDMENTPFPYRLKAKLISKSIDMGEISWNIYGVGKMFSNQSGSGEPIPFKVAMYGYNYDELTRQAEKLKSKLLKHPRINSVDLASWRYWWEKEKRFEYFLDPDKEKTPLLFGSPDRLLRMLRNRSRFGGHILSLPAGNRMVTASIVPVPESQQRQWDFFNIPYGESGIKVNNLADISKSPVPQAIYKENQNYLRIIDFNYYGMNKFGSRFLEEKLDEMKSEMPLGYHAEKIDTPYFAFQEPARQTGVVLLLILAIYVICAILFESLLQPLYIILTIPLSFTGIFLAFYLSGFNFDQGGYASFLLTGGLAVNSAIYLINEYNNLKPHSCLKPAACLRIYIRSFNRKIVPVFLTIFSTVSGLLPFMLFTEPSPFWFAFALGATGGLIFSLLIILLILPLFLVRKRDGYDFVRADH
ncbi:MAG: efflux RND transporter permease subunit [Bacteroidales bacterium]